MFNEENTVEQMVLDTLCGGEIKGWWFVSAEKLFHLRANELFAECHKMTDPYGVPQ